MQKMYKDEAILPEGAPLATPEQIAAAYGPLAPSRKRERETD
jgi:hypothetical protein